MSDASCSAMDAARLRRAAAIALGAAAVGGLGVWVYLQVHGPGTDRTQQRIETLHQRLDALAAELARYTAREK